MTATRLGTSLRTPWDFSSSRARRTARPPPVYCVRDGRIGTTAERTGRPRSRLPCPPWPSHRSSPRPANPEGRRVLLQAVTWEHVLDGNLEMADHLDEVV